MKPTQSLLLTALLLLSLQSMSKAESMSFPRHTITVGGGPLFPGAQMDTDDVFGTGDQTIGEPGYAINGQYFYSIIPRISVGVEASYMKTGKNRFDMGPLEGDLSMKSTVIMSLFKFSFRPQKTANPYLITGLGLHTSELEWNVTPSNGYFWTSGDPQESRAIISEKKSSLALTFGGGLEMNITSNFFCAVEGRLDVLGASKYEATSFGRALGLDSADAGAAHGSLLLRAGVRIGGSSQSLATPTASTPAEEPKPTPVPAGAI